MRLFGERLARARGNARRDGWLLAAAAVTGTALAFSLEGCTGTLERAAPEGSTVGAAGGPTGGGGSSPGAGAAGSAGTQATGPKGPPDPNLYDQAGLFTCASPTARSSPARVRRVDRSEWVRDIGAANRDLAFSNPFDPSITDPYSTYASDETLDGVTLELYLGVVDGAGIGWTAAYPDGDATRRLLRVKDDKGLRCMFEDDKPDAKCVRYYLEQLLQHGVYFRPATNEEIEPLQAFATTVLGQETSPEGRSRSLTRITSAAWMSVPALFHAELGEGAADADGRKRLGNTELANALSYALEGRAAGSVPTRAVYPDYSQPVRPDLVAAGQDGSVQDPAIIDKLVRAHAGGVDEARMDLAENVDDRERPVRGEYWISESRAGFFREWLGYANVARIFKDGPQKTSAFDDPKNPAYDGLEYSYENLMSGYYGYEATLVEQMDDTIARVVSADKQVFKNLLTTRQFFVASTTVSAGSSIEKSTTQTQRVYNIVGDVGDSRAERWRTMPSNERAGVLTHPVWLAAHGNNFEDDPSAVHRGKWIRTQLLCDFVPPLSAVTVQAMVGPSAPEKRARDRLLDATSGPKCIGCHGMMNPLGLPFEIYNHAGFLRVTDHDKAPDGSAVLAGMPDPSLDGPVRDGVELAEKLAQSDYAKRCFLRQAFRYFMGRDETPADGCVLLAMEQAYDANDGSFNAMLSALFTSETFLYRSDRSDRGDRSNPDSAAAAQSGAGEP